MHPAIPHGFPRSLPKFPSCVLAALLLAGCGGGGGGGGGVVIPPAPPPPPPPVTPLLAPGQALPGVDVDVVSLTGGTGPGGTFRAGDYLTLRFTVKRGDGSALPILDLNYAALIVSGPTSNYQLVIPRQNDVIARAVAQVDGTYTYLCPVPLPAVYPPPLNDTASFGAGDGELQGQPLLAGTYTAGLEAYKLYSTGTENIRDAVNTTTDFLLGGATTIEPREVVTTANCNQCHDSLRAHGGTRVDNVNQCLLCHTSGAEDRNVATVAGGTPGVSIDFRVMIHKIHNAAHLPSVNGMATGLDGLRDYTATPAPVEYVGFNNTLIEFTEVKFPVWPNLTIAMPRDQGYTALGTTQRAQEDNVRLGITACGKCHGDPDGAGPLPAPAQGANYHLAATRRACGSCHDDVDWTRPYVANLLMMPPQVDDASCTFCHETPGSLVTTVEAHVHPLVDPAFNPGLDLDLVSVAEAGINNGNGSVDPGEKVAVTFTMTDALGAPVAPSAVANISTVVCGPTSNRNILLNTSIPTGALGSGPTFSVNLPEPVLYEFLGDSTAALETFTASRAPFWTATGVTTTVQVRTASGAATTLASAVAPLANFVDVASAAGFLRNDIIVIDDGVAGREEYLRIQTVQGTRLWFSSPASSGYPYATRTSHLAGAAVQKVTLATKTAGTDYSLAAATGQVMELVEFGAGNAVLLSYTSDYVLPAVHGPPLNDSPDLDETAGDWTGKTIVSGTYTVGLWTARTLTLAQYGETNTYRGTSAPANADFRVGSPGPIEPGAIVSSPSNCYACHDDLYFHGGGRRGYETCILCHGTAGSEDRPPYVAANAPPTTGVTIDFRGLLHKIHAGRDLENAATYTVVGFGSTAYPNNFTAFNYGEVGFPVFPDGVKSCRKCHGAGSTAWQAPDPRNHPTQQVRDTLAWRAACGSCHDGSAAEAHMKSQTSPSGSEACAICHGPGEPQNVDLMHLVR